MSEANCFLVSWRHSQITYYEQGSKKTDKSEKSHHVHIMSNLIKHKLLKDKKKSPEHSPE